MILLTGLGKLRYPKQMNTTNSPITPGSSFSISRRIQFSEADPAGISFFANVYRWHHEAYEAFVTDHLRIEYGKWFLSTDVAVPIRKSEAEYFGPFHPGRTARIDFYISKLGSSSFTAESKIYNEKSVLCSTVQTVHVFMDVKSGTKLEIPAEFRNLLAN
jgi:YbgC/YbaW family acyl-CoA thioester hydrolase